ncbi:MAG: DNA mismatch repair endonuclease MutL [Candidatus Poribacteria bacterium]|nr:DNA mismatch repair endonuclease MutL [Candidatus Poribacteria bacterium]
MPIHVLPDDIANKIAAGEVVERPASIVKELIENSLDAGATEVRVELVEGGKRLVRVLDNGSGMSPEDAALCLRRHATSKLSSADDLATIRTLGFRGEALPSIASVSRLELTTRTTDGIEGTRLVVEGGKVVQNAPAGAPVGTRITVRDLIYNVPARLKFLKTDATELNHAMNHVQWAALAHPNVRFTLDHNQRTLIDVVPTATRRERIRQLHGKEFAAQLIEFTKSFETLEIECLIGEAGLSRSNRALQFFFINGRPFRDKTISAALTQATKELIPDGRHAVAFLLMEMEPTEVDVNVHPAKAEVRFHNERGVFRNIVQAITQGAAERAFVPEIPMSNKTATVVADQLALEGVAPRLSFGKNAYPEASSRTLIPPTRTSYGGGMSPYSERKERPSARPFLDGNRSLESTAPANAPPRRIEFDPQPIRRDDSNVVELESLDFDAVHIIGTIFRTYMLLAGGDSLYMIDQHAAAERINYERVLKQMESERVESQGLLTPISVELTPAQRARFDGYVEWFGKFGFHAEAFGGATVLVQAIPSTLEPEFAARTFIDLIDGLENDANPDAQWDEIRKHAAATIACHASVRAGDNLSRAEQASLLRDLSGAEHSYNCPHGRPIIVRMRRSEIERYFHRH